MPEQNTSTHFLNGQFVEEKDLLISARDLGFARGYAVFDFLITYPHHRPFMLSRHVDRLFNSAQLIGLALPWTKEQVEEWTRQTLANNHSEDEKAIKIMVSGGISSSLLPSGSPTIAILVDPRPKPSEEYYRKGASVITDRYTRFLPMAKSSMYIEGVKQAQIAEQANAVETIYYDDRQVFEGSTTNVFALINGSLQTPASNILPGITRDVLLQILKLDVPVKAADFSLEELLSAEEVFITASNKEVLPITAIDGKPIGNGAVGPLTTEVMRQFREFVLSDNWQ